MMDRGPCPGCGASFPAGPGPTHPYMVSSPGCWATYGTVLAREYGDPAYVPVHRLTVDAYAVQHPGRPSPQSIQSVALHLISLCAVLEAGVEPYRATRILQATAREKSRFIWLDPPGSLGRVTVADVASAGSAEAHIEAVRGWAESSWQAWSRHHATIRAWGRMAILASLPGRG